MVLRKVTSTCDIGTGSSIESFTDDTVEKYGVVGGSASLPCNTSAISKENYPMLVMWFKDNNLNPFYR